MESLQYERDFDETVRNKPVDLQRNLRREIRVVASRLGHIRNSIRRDSLPDPRVSSAHAERWIDAIDEMLLEFDDLSGGVLNTPLARRISAFFALANEVMDRLDALTAPPAGSGNTRGFSLH